MKQQGKWIDMVTGECREQGKVEREWDLGPRGLDAMLRNSDLTL